VSPRFASMALVVCLSLAGTARAQTNVYNSLTALWTAPGDDGDTGQVSAYELFYDTTPPGGDMSAWWNAVPYSQRISLVPPLAAAGQVDSSLVGGLTQGTQYWFVLVARDEAANVSGFSNIAMGTTQSCGAPTSSPSGFAAAADSGEVLVSWSQGSDPAALSFHLYRAIGSAPAWTLVQSLPISATSFRDTQIELGTTYRYRGTWGGPEIEGVTCEGPYSAQAVVITTDTPDAADAGSGSVHAYPNPGGDQIRLALDVNAPAPLPVRLRLFDMSGHWLATLAEGSYPPGRSLIPWDRLGRSGLRLAPGYYEILGTVGATRVRERLVLLP